MLDESEIKLETWKNDTKIQVTGFRQKHSKQTINSVEWILFSIKGSLPPQQPITYLRRKSRFKSFPVVMPMYNLTWDNSQITI